MLNVFIIIQLIFEVLRLRSYSIELMTNSFLTITPSYNDKQPHFTGGPTFYWGARPPSWLRPWILKIFEPSTELESYDIEYLKNCITYSTLLLNWDKMYIIYTYN